MKRSKKILVVIAIAGVAVALMYALLFTTAEFPDSLVNRAGSAEARPGRTALVLKWFSPSSLKSGNLILVESRSGGATVREIRKLEKIELPERSEVPRSGRRKTSRRIAQAMLDMGSEPQFWISGTDGTNTTSMIRVAGADIKGKVVLVLTKN